MATIAPPRAMGKQRPERTESGNQYASFAHQVDERVRWSSEEYNLTLLQFPRTWQVQNPAKSTTRKNKSKLETVDRGAAIDPPVVVELKVGDRDSNKILTCSPHLVLHLEMFRVGDNGLIPTRCIGSVVSSLSAVRIPSLDKRDAELEHEERERAKYAGYGCSSSSPGSAIQGCNRTKTARRRGVFTYTNIIPEVSGEGAYRFKFTLMDMRQDSKGVVFGANIKSFWSTDFAVKYLSKPSLVPVSTGLTMELAEGGIKLKVKKNTPRRSNKQQQTWNIKSDVQKQNGMVPTPLPQTLYGPGIYGHDSREVAIRNGDDITGRMTMAQTQPLVPPMSPTQQRTEQPTGQPMYPYQQHWSMPQQSLSYPSIMTMSTMASMPPTLTAADPSAQYFPGPYQCQPPAAHEYAPALEGAGYFQQVPTAPLTGQLSPADSIFAPANAGYQPASYGQQYPMASMAPQVSPADDVYAPVMPGYQAYADGQQQGHDQMAPTTTQPPSDGDDTFLLGGDYFINGQFDFREN